ncbi:hypothetical protein D9757_009393 [Collybiopsis confluens]|uniref:Uncharacterized protein n=1 Tax=Collybiopsis confluens TaxID=2823264 RepID=A0A8H5H6L8_9AGAR|nr:hypothetical protein D9757_009393 [Collybiopsis confluens]
MPKSYEDKQHSSRSRLRHYPPPYTREDSTAARYRHRNVPVMLYDYQTQTPESSAYLWRSEREGTEERTLEMLDFHSHDDASGLLQDPRVRPIQANRPRSGRKKETLKYNDRHHDDDDSEDSESATEDGSRLHDDQYHSDDDGTLISSSRYWQLVTEVYVSIEYVMMAVTKREQREILKRRDEEAAHLTRASYHQSRRYLAESSRYRSKKEDSKRSTPKSAGAGLFNHARGVTVTGGRMSVVGQDQTIIETMGEPFSMNTPRDHPLQTPPPEEDMHNRRTNDFIEDDSEDFGPSGEHGASSSRTRNDKLRLPRRRPLPRGSQAQQRSADTDVSIFSFSEDVHINGGEIAAVKRNQTIRISRYT